MVIATEVWQWAHQIVHPARQSHFQVLDDKLMRGKVTMVIATEVDSEPIKLPMLQDSPIIKD